MEYYKTSKSFLLVIVSRWQKEGPYWPHKRLLTSQSGSNKPSGTWEGLEVDMSIHILSLKHLRYSVKVVQIIMLYKLEPPNPRERRK